ncbi:hypothetical protein KFK09_020883 [Dendrobium nobile]|uniref:Uncharacterized protein n=1 Tax=Dendrobium nobile TaxID=94219 RepID=A0A8T3ANG1_DENNO|nr:hypothetical protein KFK09_020883 [Dendrobium nobile]
MALLGCSTRMPNLSSFTCGCSLTLFCSHNWKNVRNGEGSLLSNKHLKWCLIGAAQRLWSLAVFCRDCSFETYFTRSLFKCERDDSYSCKTSMDEGIELLNI